MLSLVAIARLMSAISKIRSHIWYPFWLTIGKTKYGAISKIMLIIMLITARMKTPQNKIKLRKFTMVTHPLKVDLFKVRYLSKL